jgi:hypothetical protein
MVSLFGLDYVYISIIRQKFCESKRAIRNALEDVTNTPSENAYDTVNTDDDVDFEKDDENTTPPV